MKRTFKKIFASILTIALISSVCAIAPVMAEGETTATRMEFNNEYQAWLTNNTNSIKNNMPTDSIVVKGEGVVAANPKPVAANQQIYFKNDDYYPYYPLTADNRPGQYLFGDTGHNLTVDLPTKEGYDLKTVGVVTAHAPMTYQSPFDYSYSVDGIEYIPVTNTTYTSNYVTKVNSSYYAYYETVKVPSNAQKLKITKNSNDSGSNPSVMGFSFGYMPAEMGDVLEFSASNNGEIIDLLTSGIIDNGGFDWNGYVTAQNGTDYGFGVKYGESVTINAVEGYKITSISGKIFAANAQRARAEITLGDNEWTSSDYNQEFNVSSPAGADTLTITGTCHEDAVANASSNWSIYDIKITMEKDVEELAMAVSSAVKGEEQVDVSLQVSGRASAADSSMKLLVVGYAGDVVSDVKILTVNKTDISDEYSTSLSADTTSVRAFLWKDLSTLVPILPATPAFPVG